MLMGERNSGCSTEHVDITDYRCLFCTGVECSSVDTYRHSANSVRRDNEFSSAMRDSASAYTRALQRNDMSSTWVIHSDELQA